MKYSSKFIRFLVLLLTILLVLSACSKKNPEDNENSNDQSSKRQLDVESAEAKTAVINMFLEHGEYDQGAYHFRKYNSVDQTTSVSYFFQYYPDTDSFSCSALTVSYVGAYKLTDYGTVIFSWGNVKSGNFAGIHELSDVAEIEMNFSVQEFKQDMSIGACTHTVTKNSFVNLTQESEINDYAVTMVEHINRGLGYAQSILYAKCDNVTLW